MRAPRCVAVGLLAAAALLGSASGATHAAPRPASDSPWLGRPLAEALDDLVDRGLPLVYTSEVVHPDMRVVAEPRSATLPGRLDELLVPHGLVGRSGPGGSFLVVPAERAPLRISLVAPEPGAVVAGSVEVELTVGGDEAVELLELWVDGEPVAELDAPPWRTVLDLQGEGPSWHIEALARGVHGGLDRAEVTTRGYVVRDRVEVALDRVYVSVRRRRADDRFPSALGPEHFRVVSGREELAPFAVEPARVPLSAAVVLDTSESMEGAAIEAAADGAASLLRQLSPVDEALVLLFSDRVRELTAFSREPARLAAELRGLEASGGTALNDHLYVALRLLDEAEGWPVVVLLSDGADLLSALPMEAVRRKVDSSGVAVYWLRLSRGGGGQVARTGASTAWRDADENRREHRALEDAVRSSGGRVLDLDSPDEIAGAFGEILAELNEQYVLSYVSGEDGPAATVRSTVPGLEVRWWPFEAGRADPADGSAGQRRISGADPH